MYILLYKIDDNILLVNHYYYCQINTTTGTRAYSLTDTRGLILFAHLYFRLSINGWDLAYFGTILEIFANAFFGWL